MWKFTLAIIIFSSSLLSQTYQGRPEQKPDLRSGQDFRDSRQFPDDENPEKQNQQVL